MLDNRQAAAAILPGGFDLLEPLASWCLRTETQRIRRRQESTYAEIAALSAALLPELPRIFTYLDSKPFESLCAADENLLFLTLSLAEVAPAIEFYRQASVIEGFEAARFLPVENFTLRPAR